MPFSPQDFINGTVLTEAQLDQLDTNIDEVRRSHKGPSPPPSLEAGVRWIDDSATPWALKIWDGAQFIIEGFVDPTSGSASAVSSEIRRRNLIWNGALDVWQDSRSETGVTVGTNRIADGWRFNASSSGTWTLDRQTNVPTVAQAGRNLNFSLRALVTTADATVNAGDFAILRHIVEGFAYQELYQQTQHLSFWAKSSLTGTYAVSWRNSGNDRSYVDVFTINSANTWELKQIALRTAPSGGTWDFTTGVGVDLSFALVCGTTFQTTAGAWQTGNFLSTSGQANLAASTHDFSLADVRLVGGTLRSPVIVRSFSEIMREAQRRFWKTFPYDTKPAVSTGEFGSIAAVSSGTAAGAVGYKAVYPVPMRINPTLGSYDTVATTTGTWDRGGAHIASAFTHNDTSGFVVFNNAATVDSIFHTIHVTSDARF